MILDEYNEFVDSAAPGTLTTGTFLMGDVIPFKNTTNRPATGRPIYAVIQISERFITGGTAGTVQFFLVSDANASMSASGSAPAVLAECTEHARTIALITDDATALDTGVGTGAANYVLNQIGQRPMCVALPFGDYEKYLGVLVTIGTTTLTGGKIDAFLTDDPTIWRAYADAIA